MTAGESYLLDDYEGLLAFVAALEVALKRHQTDPKDASRSLLRLASIIKEFAQRKNHPAILGHIETLEQTPPNLLKLRARHLIAALLNLCHERLEQVTLLVVEPDRKLARQLKTHLMSSTRNLVLASTAEQALDVLDNTDISVILLDLELPDREDGQQLIGELKTHPKGTNIPTIVLTRNPDLNSRSECYALGARHFFYIPDELAVIATATSAVLHQTNRIHHKLSYDHLTGLLNRDGLGRSYDRLLLDTIQRKSCLSLAIVDFDEFKKVNDDYGHNMGDEVLRRSAASLRHSLRPGDVVARWGGDEFIVLLPDADLSGATSAMNRARAKLHEEIFSEGERAFRVSFTFGISELRSLVALEQAVEEADRPLYENKEIRKTARLEKKKAAEKLAEERANSVRPTKRLKSRP